MITGVVKLSGVSFEGRDLFFVDTTHEGADDTQEIKPFVDVSTSLHHQPTALMIPPNVTTTRKEKFYSGIIPSYTSLLPSPPSLFNYYHYLGPFPLGGAGPKLVKKTKRFLPLEKRINDLS